MFVKIASDVWVNLSAAQAVRIGPSKSGDGKSIFLSYADHVAIDESDEYSFETEELARVAICALNGATGAG